MPRQTLSRRTFLAAASLGTAALVVGCEGDLIELSPVVPTGSAASSSASPALPGPYQTSQVILGEGAGTVAMPQPFQSGEHGGLPISQQEYDALPKHVLAAVYYPNNPRDHRPVPTPNPLQLSRGPFPLLLYAHAFRSTLGTTTTDTTFPPTRDFTTIGTMLSHVASYGCICVAPDLSWLPELDPGSEQTSWNERAVVLVNYFTYLVSLNATLFAQQLDATRLVLVGHSRGAGGATHTGRILAGFGNHPKSLAYGLIAPELGGDANTDIHNLLVLGSDIDTAAAGASSGADAEGAYTGGGTPKTWVTIPGAGHFSYTDICGRAPATPCADVQHVGGAYLAALLRYYVFNDGSMRPYLAGAQMVEGLNLTDLQVQAQGYILPPPHLTVPPKAQP